MDPSSRLRLPIRHRSRRCIVWLALSCVITASLLDARGLAQAPSTPRFETEIRPLLREYCLDCHGATETLEGSLDLRLVRFIQTGGDSGPSLIPSDPNNSLVMQRVTDDEMPPGEMKLSAEKKELLRAWIQAGAPTLRPEPESIGPGIPLTETERAYWAYQPIQRPELHRALDGDRIRTPVDALLAEAMPEGLTFSPDASRPVLIRRVFMDLLGLPPTPEQMSHWSTLEDPRWYEAMVDEALKSPAYGERWARHWLDAVGYADSDGATLADAERAWIWRYRDYVIRSLNDDKPFDRFLMEQLAGDELAGPVQGDWTQEQIEGLIATGFLRMAADGTGSGDNTPEARNKTIADTLQIVGSTLLGSSLHCAQCHDHRYDPISHQDYFALRAVIEPALDWQKWKTPPERLISLATIAERQQSAELEEEAKKISAEKSVKEAEYIRQALDQELMKFEEPLRTELRAAYEMPADQRTDAQKSLLDKHPSVNISPGVLYQYLPAAAEDLKTFDARIQEVRAKKPAETFVHALVEPAGHAPTARLFHRGDHNQPTREVQPGKLGVLIPEGADATFAADDPALPTTGRRLAMARWLTQSENPNPLMLRALVNRVWMHHFGKGIVATPGDFGRLGAQPTHPQVLDWLASEWVANGWSLKQLHRTIMTSTVYRQSSHRHPAGDAIDPDNRTYWRKPMLRMDAEVLRDSILSVSGSLNREMFGPPIAIQEDETGQVRIDPAQPRRSLYARWRRTQPVAMLQSFDAPVMGVNCDVRSSSTVPTQSLMLMNGDFVLDQSNKIAQRIASQVQAAPADATSVAPTFSWTLPSPPPSPWHYGTGSVHEETGRVQDFIPLAHFTGSQWQGGSALPDADLGWVLLHPQGGHPGNQSHPAIRRWMAPSNGKLTIAGTLGHGSEGGDGVRARISSPAGMHGPWISKAGTVATPVAEMVVSAGDAIDFIVDCMEHETSDSFTWPVTLAHTQEDGTLRSWDSATGFQGPQLEDAPFAAQVIAAWSQILLRSPTEDELATVYPFVTQQLTLFHEAPDRVLPGSNARQQVLINLCQALLSSNEFLYIE